MQTVLYARVSTTDQTAAHQRTQAEAAGFKIDHVVTDEGVSGVATVLADRPQGRRLFDMLRQGDVLVVRWVDRLGRNYQDVTETIREFMRRGVIVRTVINGMTFDGATTDPVQMAVRDALIGFMAATAQAQAEAIKEAQKAGIEHAKGREDAYLGRKPSYTRDQFVEVVDRLNSGEAVQAVAKATGISRGTVYRIRDNRAEAEAALARWAAYGNDGGVLGQIPV
ncbi:recombinase family protein [Methylobacterium sp. Leaf466]|uniref:recombinase family protein n=1 Tax=Methylobacterium sp. Leaf466 TaxID=1736386 RepID=UPI0006F74889|nr:recombinase family protein [Methylobacterium sp. Leaf466]KQT81085.1 recombinase [Methylobacterium sp. Leaf466]